MSFERVKGLAAANALFDRVPQAAREELGVELAIIARDVLAVQQLQVPKDTGALEAALSIRLLIDQLRVRIGLVGRRTGSSARGRRKAGSSLGAAYYGRFVALGIRAQTVLVQRRRRVGGALRTLHRRKRAEDIAATYRLRIKGQPARDFINIGEAEDRIVANRLANFWSNTIDRAAGGAFN